MSANMLGKTIFLLILILFSIVGCDRGILNPEDTPTQSDQFQEQSERNSTPDVPKPVITITQEDSESPPSPTTEIEEVAIPPNQPLATIEDTSGSLEEVPTSETMSPELDESQTSSTLVVDQCLNNFSASAGDVVTKTIQLEGVEFSFSFNNVLLSPDGSTIAYTDKKQLCLFTLFGERLNCVNINDRFADLKSFHWSPDGRDILFSENAFTYRIDSDVRLFHADSGSLGNLTDDGNDEEVNRAHPIDYSPIWVDAGDSVAFFRYFNDETAVFRISRSGGEPVELFKVPVSSQNLAASPNGKYFAYIDTHPNRRGVYLRGIENAETILLLTGLYGVVEFSADSQYLVALPLPGEVDDPTPVIVSIMDLKNIAIQLDNDMSSPLIGFGWMPTGAGYMVSTGFSPRQDSYLYFTEHPSETGHLIFQDSLISPAGAFDSYQSLRPSNNNSLLIFTMSTEKRVLTLATICE